MVALLATGGSTNHTMHLVAMAAAAGINLTWRDFAELSQVVPLLARIYPNGSADINQFHEAGGTASLFSALLEVGLLHEDVLDGRRARAEPLLPGARADGGRAGLAERPAGRRRRPRCAALTRPPLRRRTAASACSRARSGAA